VEDERLTPLQRNHLNLICAKIGLEEEANYRKRAEELNKINAEFNRKTHT
jgi:hypothetical protein